MLDSSLPSPYFSKGKNSNGKRIRAFFSAALVFCIVLAVYHFDATARGLSWAFGYPVSHPHPSEPTCPQPEPLSPEFHASLANELEREFGTDDFKAKAVNWISGAVQIPTESYDHMSDVGSDDRWEIFGKFHDYLLAAFPTVHEHLQLTKVNTYGLIYTWPGSDTSLKPLLLMAHQDVVPVNPGTISEWIHPPYSGHFDGEFIWGRGSGDDKSGLIGILITLETLLKKGFQPKRSIVLASGFDEEASGTFGAQNIAKYLLTTYGENYFAMLVDEGGGHAESFGARVAVPGVGEKGYMDVRIEVESPGGHSSVPPKHTSIGLLALALVHLEENPQPAVLTRASPLYSTWLCHAEHAPLVPKNIKRAFRRSLWSDKALRRAGNLIFKLDDQFRALVQTTQAIDIIEGGVKANALPEQASAIVNHRISTDSSIEELLSHLTELLHPIAEKYNLGYEAFGVNVTTTSSAAGTLRLSDPWNKGLVPAPRTPTDAAPFKLLAGTIRQTWATGLGKDSNQTMIVAPGMMSGNTDTRFFWNLTPHIFRYNHGGVEDTYAGVHTVNEAIRLKGFLESIRFFTLLVLNADEADL